MSLACGGGGHGSVDASVDAGKDGSVRIADAGIDRIGHDAGNDRDASPVERHFIDAAVQCEGGAAWGPCLLTDAAELACDASSDCTWQSNGSCCGVPTFGVNKSAPPIGCPAPPCPPPSKGEPQPECDEFLTQDCQTVGAATDIVVECVEHRCLTRAAAE